MSDGLVLQLFLADRVSKLFDLKGTQDKRSLAVNLLNIFFSQSSSSSGKYERCHISGAYSYTALV